MIDARATETARPNIFDGTSRAWKRLEPACCEPHSESCSRSGSELESIVVYGRDAAQNRSHVSLIPWSEVHRRFHAGMPPRKS